MTSQPRTRLAAALPPAARPRLGFLGTGWIGRHRLQAIAAGGAAEIAAIAEPDPAMAAEAARLAPGAVLLPSLDRLLEAPLDGIVIATPSAQHAAQSIAALQAGLAVFCQKPLGRSAAEVAATVEAARRADRLLDVDFSYRHADSLRRIRALLCSGALGRVHAVDLVFHNAYGPDKPWFYDPALSGGGCLMDLGVHLVDLALWMLDWPEVVEAQAQLYAGGTRLGADPDTVEDYAAATLVLGDGTLVRLATSWRLHAGQDAVIGASFHGTAGGAEWRNVDGSFYDFVALHHRGTSSTVLCEPPDAWGGRAAAAWAERLCHGTGFDPAVTRVLDVARVIDRLYGRR